MKLIDADLLIDKLAEKEDYYRNFEHLPITGDLNKANIISDIICCIQDATVELISRKEKDEIQQHS